MLRACLPGLSGVNVINSGRSREIGGLSGLAVIGGSSLRSAAGDSADRRFSLAFGATAQLTGRVSAGSVGRTWCVWGSLDITLRVGIC
jgi:hypothetical protein